MTPSDDKISEDRREALRYALAIGSGAALAAAVTSPASAQATADNTLDRIRANKVLRIAVLPGELPYFSKDLATGNWSGFSIEMANDLAKLLDVKLEYTESTYGNSVLDLQSNKIDLGFALNPTPQRALVIDFCAHRLSASLWRHAWRRAWKPKILTSRPGRISTSPSVNDRGRCGLGQRDGCAPLRTERDHQVAEVARRGDAGDVIRDASIAWSTRWCLASRRSPRIPTSAPTRFCNRRRSPFPAAWVCGARRTSAGAISSPVWVEYNRGIGQMREWFVKGRFAQPV